MRDKLIEIYSERVWLDGQLEPATIGFKKDKIVEITKGEKKEEADDYGDAVIMPGVIDAHVHINEPGRADWEGFHTATIAAAAGGTTTLIDMPLNSSPVVTTPQALQRKMESAVGQLHVNCGFWAGATENQVDLTIHLVNLGCLGVKVFLSDSGLEEFPKISPEKLDQLFSNIKGSDAPILAHCELDTLPATHALESTPNSYSAYLDSRPNQWENEAIKLLLELGEKHNHPIHIVHLSSADLLNTLGEKKATVPLTVETCPHYLLFDAESIEDGDTVYKCAPPIREKPNRLQLIEGIKKGIIDLIASDHSPAPANLKALDSGSFKEAWGGISGLQFLLSGSWTALREELELEAFIPLLTQNPAKFIGMEDQLGKIEEGYYADFTIWRPEDSFEVKPSTIFHKHKTTPYLGKTLFGKVECTMVNGRRIFEIGRLQTKNRGSLILGKTKTKPSKWS